MTTVVSAIYCAAKEHGLIAGDSCFEKYHPDYYICSIADGLGRDRKSTRLNSSH